MVELIEEIVHAEQEAEQTVTEARERAAKMKRQTEEELSAALSEAREEAKEEASRRIEAARNELDATSTRRNDQREEAAEFMRRHAEEIDDLVRNIVALILTTEIEHSGSEPSKPTDDRAPS